MDKGATGRFKKSLTFQIKEILSVADISTSDWGMGVQGNSTPWQEFKGQYPFGFWVSKALWKPILNNVNTL